MSQQLKIPTVNDTPEEMLEKYIAGAASRVPPIPVESEEGKVLYRTLAQYVWRKHQRPTCANDIRDLWQRIDTIKRGSPVSYDICGIHFWAADYANALASESLAMDPATNQRLAAWLEDWPHICILGQTGRGKSSTINRLFGVKIADVSHHTACTRTVSDYRLVTGTFMNRPTGVVLWDVPGFGDPRMPWDHYVRLYRRLARKCDVVVFMLDNERNIQMDVKMLNKLKRLIKAFDGKLVVAINKADLFHPYTWDEKNGTPSLEMMECLQERIGVIAEGLNIKKTERIVPISALRNWNIYSLLTAMVDSAGDSKGANLLRAVRPDDSGREGVGRKSSGEEVAQRFGISRSMRAEFRALLPQG